MQFDSLTHAPPPPYCHPHLWLVINTSLELQLASIYGTSGKKNVPSVQNQENGNCSGVFAIANAVETCFGNYPWISQKQFKKEEMRSHLIKCFDDGKFTIFPSEETFSRRTVAKVHITSITCSCGMSDSMNTLVSCKSCTLLQHATCIELKENIQDACANCPNAMKN